MKVKITDFWQDGRAQTYEGELVVRPGEMAISFGDADLKRDVTYIGEQVSRYRWKLTCPDVQGRASISLSSIDPCFLEGRFQHNRNEGMWLVELDDDFEELFPQSS